ncbi:hypothetical protein BGZ65_009484, partial [Modicella reniformis]
MQPEEAIDSQESQPKKRRSLNMVHLNRAYDPPGWKRQLDIHFRLYREDFLNSLRNGLMAFLDVLAKTAEGQEDDLLKKKTLKGRYDNVNVDVYGGVQFLEVDCGVYTGRFAIISFYQPHQIKKKSKEKRLKFWEQSRKRLMPGSLVFFVSRANSNIVDPSSALPAQVVLGTVIDRKTDTLSNDEHCAKIQISLEDPRMYITMLNRNHEQWFLVEPSGGLFESYRTVLETLQEHLPAMMPFGKYLAPNKEETDLVMNAGSVDPPMYTRVPSFRFDLSILLKGKKLELDVNNPESIDKGTRALQESKVLDVTQSKAFVEALSREIALISGPPGTGKTKIGVELMQVLLHNMKATDDGPILCICYTNHALDQFLEHLLDKDITNIIRIGSRSKSERLKQCNLEGWVQEVYKPYYMRETINTLKEEWDSVTDKFKELQKALESHNLSWEYVEHFLKLNNPDQWVKFNESPLPSLSSSDTNSSNDFTEGLSASGTNSSEDFTKVSHGKQQSGSVFQQWIEGTDIKEMKRWNEEILRARESTWFTYSMNPFGVLGDGDDEWKGEDDELEEDQEPFMYEIPSTDRTLELLDDNIWEMSMSERKRLKASWLPRAQELMRNEMVQLLERAEKITKTRNAAFDETRRTALCRAS